MQPETIKIIDLGECNALLAVGFALVRLEQSASGRHKVFIFQKAHPVTPETTPADTIERYHSRSLLVDAFTFYRAGKEIKSRIHDQNELASLM